MYVAQSGHTLSFHQKELITNLQLMGLEGLIIKLKIDSILTLECIRRYYKNENNPLTDTIK